MASPHSLQVDTTYRQIIKLALPISFAMLIPQFNFVTTNIFLGHYNQESLAIAGITGVYYLIFAMIGFGLNNGLQALIARRAGENRPEEIGQIFSQGIYIAFAITAIVFSSPGFLLQHFKTGNSFRGYGRKGDLFFKDPYLGIDLFIHLSNAKRIVGRNQPKQIPCVWYTG
jgi:Na+-driven multidrug efflux pump